MVAHSNALNADSTSEDRAPQSHTLLTMMQSLTAEQMREVEAFLRLPADQRSLVLHAAQQTPLASPGPSLQAAVSPHQLVPDTPLGHETVQPMIRRIKNRRVSPAMAAAARHAQRAVHAGLQDMVLRNESQLGNSQVNHQTAIRAAAQSSAALLPERGCTDVRRRMTGAFQRARVRRAVANALMEHGMTRAQLVEASSQMNRGDTSRNARRNRDFHYSHRDRRNHQRRLENGTRAQPPGTDFRFDSRRAAALVQHQAA